MTGTIGTPSIVMQWRRIVSCYVFTLLEIFASQFTVFDQMITRWRTPVFSQEIALLRIAPSEKVLHIGCGAFPTASLFIARDHHTEVVGIDNNSIAVSLAQSYVKRRHLSSKIKILFGDGTRYPLADFDVIFIAINVWPIDAVMAHCAEAMKPTARILCKGTNDDINRLFEQDKFRSGFTIAQTLNHQKTQSFVLVKKT
jgi:precorrin-6B methylase 2